MLSQILVLAAVLCSQTEDARRIIQLHEDALSRMHSIRAKLETRLSIDGGKTWKLATQVTYLRSGGKERIHETIYGGYYAGRWMNRFGHRDLADGPTESRVITGLNPNNPPRPPLTGRETPNVNGAISPPQQSSPYGRMNSFSLPLLLRLGPDYTLEQLYRASKTKTMKKGREDAAGEVHVFGLDTPDGKFSYVVSVAPEHNYCISKVKSKARLDNADSSRMFSYTSEVIQFYDYDFGLSLPRKIRTLNEAGDRTEISLTIDSINTPIPDEELELEFLPGMIVNDGVKMALHVWGDQGPALSFGTQKEMVDWIKERDRKALASGALRRPVPWGFVAAFLALSLCLILLIVYRLRSGRRLSSHAT